MLSRSIKVGAAYKGKLKPGTAIFVVVKRPDASGQPVGMPFRGQGLRSGDQHRLGSARRDRAGELGDQVLGGLAAADLQHGPCRVGADAGGN